MKLKNAFPGFKAFRLLTLMLVVSGYGERLEAQNNQQGFVQLREGVIINKNRNELYIATPQWRVQAISIAAGQPSWTSNTEAMPLAVFNTKLLCLDKNTTRGNKIGIVELSLSSRGSKLLDYTTALPDSVNTGNANNANSVFTISPRFVQNNTYLSWQYTYYPVRGIYDEQSQQQENNRPTVDSGAFRLEKTAGKLRVMKNIELPPGLNQQSPVMVNNINNEKGQFFSADRLHTMTGTSIASDDVFERYRWEVFEAATGRKLSELTDYRSYAPFYVSGNTIIYEKGPYARLINGNMTEEPLVIVAVDLQNGNMLWKKEILDNVNRGPVPPGMEQ